MYAYHNNRRRVYIDQLHNYYCTIVCWDGVPRCYTCTSLHDSKTTDRHQKIIHYFLPDIFFTMNIFQFSEHKKEQKHNNIIYHSHLVTLIIMYGPFSTKTYVFITLMLCVVQQCKGFNVFHSNLHSKSAIRSTITSTLHATKRSGAMSRKKRNDGKNNEKSSGFGKSIDEDSSSSSSTVEEIPSGPSGAIYSRPALYDLAFGYRNYDEEVKFLLESHDKFSLQNGDDQDNNENDGKDRNILEFAAGPARHSITSLRNHPNKVSSCTAIDLSTDMMEYSNEIADEELGDSGYGGIRDRFQYVAADMRTVGMTDVENNDEYDDENNVQALKKMKQCSYDSAWILLGSMQHLTTNDDVISCFKSANNLLRPGGTMVIELPHPRETFTMVECTKNSWEVPLEDENGDKYGELKIIWGDDDDTFDPIRQVRDFTVAMDLTIDDDASSAKDENTDLQSVREVVPMRLFTYQEIDALSRICDFEVVSLHGALSDEIDVNNEDQSFRLVCVLRKLS